MSQHPQHGLIDDVATFPNEEQLQESILNQIVSFYLKGEDFNGLTIFRGEDLSDRIWSALFALIKQGDVQVVTGSDYLNPHIRPWASRRTVEDQISSVEQIRNVKGASEEDRVCLYPTPQAMNSKLDGHKYVQEPYRRELALGNGTLELRFFSMDAMEGYRNDPRYYFTFGDFGLSFGIGDEAYLDDNEPEKDKVSALHVGFAYVLPKDDSDPITRRICMFLCDLSKLSPEHQRRMESYEVKGVELVKLQPHPVWFGSQMGHWPDGIGLFEKILLEMEAINKLSISAYGEPLFKNVDRPREFGWVLRASQSEWDGFVLQADKLLSDNLNGRALDAMGAPKTDDSGKVIGTIGRLQWVLENRTNLGTEQVKMRLRSFREVREARQKPAHALRNNVHDSTIVRKQRDLLSEISTSLEALEILFSRHPKNQSWKPDELLKGTVYVL